MARPAVVERDFSHALTLNLSPLVAPHRKQGRLKLRIERMPQTARLSQGTRNNDGSWSLQSDELDDLCFLTADPLEKEVRINVRVIGLANGNTLASIEHAITPGAAPLSTSSPAETTLHTRELETLRHELAAAKDALAARDAELADRLGAAANEAATQFQHTLSKAEAAWSATENARLQAIQEQWQEKFAEALVDAEEEQARKYTDAIEALNAKLEEFQLAVSERDAALAHAKEAGSAAVAQSHDAARDTNAKITALEAALGERDAELARAVAAKDAVKREADLALVKAEAAWKDAEAERLAAAEAHWREASAMAMAEAQADADTLREQGAQNDPDLLEHFTQLQAAVAERDAALERAQAAAEQARTEADTRLAEAEKKWKSAEAARAIASDAAWQKKLAAASAARTTPAPAPANDTELRTLREKLAAVQAKLDLREATVAKAANLANEERLRWQKEAQDQIVKASRERKADDAARLATAQAEWSRQSARDLALATSRAEAAEAALAQVRMRTKNDTQLHTELAALRAALAVREGELADLRRHAEDLSADDGAKADTQPRRPGFKTRDILIACGIGMLAVIGWLQISEQLMAPPPAPVVPAETQTASAPAQPANPIVALTKDAKLRKAASPAADVIVKLKTDTRLEVLARNGEWAHVREAVAPPKGKPAEGWVRASFLKFVKEDAPATK